MVKYQLTMFSPKFPPIFDAFDILSFDKISYLCISVFVGCHWVGEQYLDPCSLLQIFIVTVGPSNGCWSKVALCSWSFSLINHHHQDPHHDHLLSSSIYLSFAIALTVNVCHLAVGCSQMQWVWATSSWQLRAPSWWTLDNWNFWMYWRYRQL